MSKTTNIIDSPKTDKRILIKINEILDREKINYSTIARALGFEPEYGSPLMRGKRGLSANHLIKIAEILGVSPASLLPGDNPITKPDFEEYIKGLARGAIKNDTRRIIKEEIQGALEIFKDEIREILKNK